MLTIHREERKFVKRNLPSIVGIIEGVDLDDLMKNILENRNSFLSNFEIPTYHIRSVIFKYLIKNNYLRIENSYLDGYIDENGYDGEFQEEIYDQIIIRLCNENYLYSRDNKLVIPYVLEVSKSYLKNEKMSNII